MAKTRNTENNTYLVTMALPYANGDIHLGHLVEAVQADVFVRYKKLRGNRVVYICADDTHGTPIELSALNQKISPRQLIDAMHANHVRDYAGFDIDFDIFYSTNSPENRTYAEFVFGKLRENGLIVEREIEQYYCEHDKRFLPDRFIAGTCPRCGAKDQYGDVCEACGATYEPPDLLERRCKLCNHEPVSRRSKHLFVDLSSSEPFLREYLNTGNVLQRDMLNFVNNWIGDGLHQWCISRDGPYFGFEIPGYPGKFFYVWLDAPIGYVSSTAKWCAEHGESIDDFWAEKSAAKVVHFIGKDIVYFHTLFWPVMLKNAGFNIPSKFFIHGFLSIQGEKMSKSRGTFICARDLVDNVRHPQIGEFLRFYYAAKLSNDSGDIDLNFDEFRNRVNTVLVNNIGNLHHRTFVFARRSFNGRIPDAPWDETIADAARCAAEEVAACYETVDYRTAVAKIHALGNLGNKYYQDSKPWELIKEKPEEAARVIVTCANLVKTLAVLLKPIVPRIVEQIERQLKTTFSWSDSDFSLRDIDAGEIAKLARPIEPEELQPILGRFTPPAQAAGVTEKTGTIEIDEFKRADLRVAVVTQAEAIPKSDKLLKLQVDIGGEQRQIIAGIARHYSPGNMVGRQIIVVANLAPAKLMGLKSEGMLLAVHDGESLVLLRPDTPVGSGTHIS